MGKNNMFAIIVLMVLICSCNQSGKQTDSDDSEFQTQAEINEASYNDCVAYMDSVEMDFQYLISALPQYENEFNKEKDVWEQYMDAIREVANCEEHGSSTPMYVNDVVNQGTTLWSESMHNLCLYLQANKPVFSKTTFTSSMIADSYAAFIKAVGEGDYAENASDYQESLRKEQKCWNDWMECREVVSQKLTDELRTVYDGCTNQMMRTKLLQLKNQNQALGLISGDVLECALPDDCSDKELLEYPGFDKVWAE